MGKSSRRRRLGEVSVNPLMRIHTHEPTSSHTWLRALYGSTEFNARARGFERRARIHDLGAITLIQGAVSTSSLLRIRSEPKAYIICFMTSGSVDVVAEHEHADQPRRRGAPSSPTRARKFQRWSNRFTSTANLGDLLLAVPSVWAFTRYLPLPTGSRPLRAAAHQDAAVPRFWASELAAEWPSAPSVPWFRVHAPRLPPRRRRSLPRDSVGPGMPSRLRVMPGLDCECSSARWRWRTCRSSEPPRT